MIRKNPSLGFVITIQMHIQNLVQFYQFVLKVMIRNKTMTDGQRDRPITDDPNPVKLHFSKWDYSNNKLIFCAVRPRGYKTFSYSTQLSKKLILLINVKMPTIVGILTFISMINTTSEKLLYLSVF